MNYEPAELLVMLCAINLRQRRSCDPAVPGAETLELLLLWKRFHLRINQAGSISLFASGNIPANALDEAISSLTGPAAITPVW